MKQSLSTVTPVPTDANRPPTGEEQSLARGFVYRLVATAFRYPRPDTLDAVREQGQAMTDALAVLNGSSDSRLSEHSAELQSWAERMAPDALEESYVSIFSHAVRGSCPLYETEYGEGDGRLQLPHELSDLSAFYHAFGLQLGSQVQERVDFIAVECEFMAFLCVKQAYAEEHGDAELAAITIDAQRKFLRDHLGRWTPAFARRIIDQSHESFYRPLAHFTLAYMTDECRRLDVTPGNEHLTLRLPLKEEDACQSCPMAEGNTAVESGVAFPSKG